MNTDRGNRTTASNIPALEGATKRSWAEWLQLFEQAGATALAHPEIARIARQAMPGELQNPDWWAQGVAIAFEQSAGLRVPGQSATGEYRVGASRTLSLSREEATERWDALNSGRAEQGGHRVADVRRSTTAKRSFWRATLEGAGQVEVSVEAKGEDRSVCTVQHTRLLEADSIETWRAHWKSRLAEL